MTGVLSSALACCVRPAHRARLPFLSPDLLPWTWRCAACDRRRQHRSSGLLCSLLAALACPF